VGDCLFQDFRAAYSIKFIASAGWQWSLGGAQVKSQWMSIECADVNLWVVELVCSHGRWKNIQLFFALAVQDGNGEIEIEYADVIRLFNNFLPALSLKCVTCVIIEYLPFGCEHLPHQPSNQPNIFFNIKLPNKATQLTFYRDQYFQLTYHASKKVLWTSVFPSQFTRKWTALFI
jgi:hypothetical protein